MQNSYQDYIKGYAAVYPDVEITERIDELLKEAVEKHDAFQRQPMLFWKKLMGTVENQNIRCGDDYELCQHLKPVLEIFGWVPAVDTGPPESFIPLVDLPSMVESRYYFYKK